MGGHKPKQRLSYHPPHRARQVPGSRTSMFSDFSPTRGPRRRELPVDEYSAGVRACNVSVLARALTLIESSSPRHQQAAEELLTRLLPYTGQSIRVGISGPPGVGKSTFIDALG